MTHLLHTMETAALAICGMVAHNFSPIVGGLAITFAVINGAIQLYQTIKGRHHL